jgi:hypothetical protein
MSEEGSASGAEAKQYATSLEKGLEYEDFAFDLLRQHGLTVTRFVSRKWQLRGECSAGIEVKFDDRLADTGNVYIETGEKSRPDPTRDYWPSGIYRDDNTWLYAIGNYQVLYVFGKQHLRSIEQKIPADSKRRKQIPTSKGFVLTAKEAERNAEKVIDLGASVRPIQGGVA